MQKPLLLIINKELNYFHWVRVNDNTKEQLIDELLEKYKEM